MQYGKSGRRGGSNFGPGRFPPKPVEIGKEYDVEILEISRRGEGIARIKGLVCFVPNTKQGDHVRIRITSISRRFAEAEAVGEAEEKPVEAETEAVTEEIETTETAEAEAVEEAEEKPAEAETEVDTEESETVETTAEGESTEEETE
ncbi:TRAM domain-containing protein [Candidatus Bathyarchaeota archaeon]|nr:TRAM domain-containing protein [Candidatus Bathyarchaeota archaeon]